MKTEKGLPQTSEVILKGRWVKVQIHAPTYALTHTCNGYVYCLEGRRLLDQLNDVFPSAMPENKDFLPVSEVEMYSLRGEMEAIGTGMETVHFACLNKANILFVRESEGYQARGIGGEFGHKDYPYVAKSSIVIRLHLPFYIITGYMHCAKGERISDVMNGALNFLPVTNVTICPSVGQSESGIEFVAVNKRQIILLEDLETTKAKVSVPTQASKK